MFKKEIWNKFTEFTFLKFWNKVNFPQALIEHTRVRIIQKTINQYQQI